LPAREAWKTRLYAWRSRCLACCECLEPICTVRSACKTGCSDEVDKQERELYSTPAPTPTPDPTPVPTRGPTQFPTPSPTTKQILSCPGDVRCYTGVISGSGNLAALGAPVTILFTMAVHQLSR
jgi:hypothetical protein